jgi:hypothetical protein
MDGVLLGRLKLPGGPLPGYGSFEATKKSNEFFPPAPVLLRCHRLARVQVCEALLSPSDYVAL